MTRNLNWTVLLDELGILQHIDAHGYYDLHAGDIRRTVNASPRLMCSMNTGKEVPQVLLENGVSVLAISNGVYRLSRATALVKVPLLAFTQLYPLRRLDNWAKLSGPLKDKNETDLLAIAATSNMLSDCFGELVSINLGGTERGWFNFTLEGLPYNVEGVQIQTDGYYQTEKAVHVVEVKTHDVEEVSIRQVLYSKRLAEQIYGGTKQVHSWLLAFDKETEHFNFYYFNDSNGEYSFNRDKCKKYVLKEKESATWRSMNV